MLINTFASFYVRDKIEKDGKGFLLLLSADSLGNDPKNKRIGISFVCLENRCAILPPEYILFGYIIIRIDQSL